MRGALSLPCLALALASCAFSPGAAAILRDWANVGPAGGTVYQVAASRVDANHVLVSSTSGVRQTLDGGTTWSTLSAPCEGTFVFGPDALYLNCATQVMRSADRGGSWQSYGQELAVETGSEFLAHPTRERIAARWSFPTLEVTTDGGHLWQRRDQPPDLTASRQYVAFAFDARNENRLLALRHDIATGNTDLMASDTLGLGSWTVVSTVTQTNTQQICYGRALAQDMAGAIYVAADCGVAISRDGGATWELRAKAEVGVTFLGTSKVHADPQRVGRVAVLANDRAAVTDDGGRSWTVVASAINAQASVAIGADGTVWSAQNGIVTKRPIGGAAATAAVGLRNASPQGLVIAGVNSDVFLAFSGGALMRSADAGATWSKVASADPAMAQIIAVPGQPQSLYGVTGGFSRTALWFSSDAGATWTTVPLPSPPAGYTDLGWFTPVGPQPGVVYGSLNQPFTGFITAIPFPASLIKSLDGGRTWSGIDSGISGEGRSLYAVPSDPASLYVTTSTGAFRTRDGGATWQALPNGAPRDGWRVDARDPSVVYRIAGPSNSWMVSQDGGAQWRPIVSPDPGTNSSYSVCVDPLQSRRLYVVDSRGAVFESLDAGGSWHRHTVGATQRFPVGAASIAVKADVRTLVAEGDATVISHALSAPRARALGTDLWFDPAEPGWGLSIVQHDNLNMFVVWFTYDALGKATWRFVSGGTWTDPDTFTGTLAMARIPPQNFFNASFDPSTVVTTVEGVATLRFSSSDRGEATFAFANGTVLRKPITRMTFGPVAALRPPVADLWWRSAESGWGISLHQQYSSIFATWFVYDRDGTPTWLVAPAATINDGGSVAGDVYRPSTTPGPGFSARAITMTNVGSLSTYDSGGRHLRYTVDGFNFDRPIEPLPF